MKTSGASMVPRGLLVPAASGEDSGFRFQVSGFGFRGLGFGFQVSVGRGVQLSSTDGFVPRFDGLASEHACLSIPCNIAEGSARGTRKDYASFIAIAKGSCAELETLLDLCVDLELVDGHTPTREDAASVGKMLIRLHESLRAAPKRSTLKPET